MATAPFRYARATDNMIEGRAPTITVPSGTVETGYESTYLSAFGNSNLGRPMRFTTTSATILIDWATAVNVQLLSLWHNFDAGLNVRWQGNASNSWGSPSQDQPITIDAKLLNGYTTHPFLRLTQLAGNGSYRYNRIVIPTNSVPVGLKLFLSGVDRGLTHDFAIGFRRIPSVNVTIGATDSGFQWRYRIPSMMLRLEGHIIVKDTTDAIDLRNWFDDSTNNSDLSDVSLLVPNPDVNQAEFVRWAGSGSDGMQNLTRSETLAPGSAKGQRDVSIAFEIANAGAPEWV